MTDPILPALPVKKILQRTGLQPTKDCVETARVMAEEAIEIVARRAAQEAQAQGKRRIDGDAFATWWRV